MTQQNPVELAEFLNQQALCESLTIKEVQTLLEYTELVTLQRDEVIADVGEVARPSTSSSRARPLSSPSPGPRPSRWGASARAR
ncbi:MAG: hypothetical protein ACOC48_02755 [Thiohalospira sp.]